MNVRQCGLAGFGPANMLPCVQVACFVNDIVLVWVHMMKPVQVAFHRAAVRVSVRVPVMV